MAILQRRLGPDTTGIAGLLQPFADALKLLTKELLHPEHSVPALNLGLPVITLGSNLAGYAFLPSVEGAVLIDVPLQLIATLGLIGVGVHGVLYVA